MKLHHEGHSFLQHTGLGLLCISLAGWLLLPRRGFYTLIGLTFPLFGFLVSFFRQPTRHTPDAPNLVISPADGTIVDIKTIHEKEYLGDERLMVSIFLSVFNVHINWIPIPGRVLYQQYHAGQYLVAFHPKSSELNERNTVVIEAKNGATVLVRQIAGLLARRIRWYVQPDQAVQAGDELGFIKFGSRVDIFLPLESLLKVQLYQQVRGGETILAEILE